MTEEKAKVKKESFMQGVMTIMFSQILIKVLGLIYTLYLTNRDGFGDAGNAIYISGIKYMHYYLQFHQ
jgi:O-antigen/teichoic acid export membrane protein